MKEPSRFGVFEVWQNPMMPMTRFPRLLAPLLTAILLLSRGLPAATPDYNLPDLGDESAALLSPQDERRLGEDFMREARARLDLLEDPELNEYLQRLGRRLTAGIDGQPEFRFFIVNNPAINAFAVPGGFVGVHTGLLLAARNEAELAAVLAHETAHITQRHIPRLMAAGQRMSGAALAAILAGILIAASGQPGGEAAVALASAGLAQNEINFTRAYEQEADRIGMNLLNGAGYDAQAMPAFFERMEALTRLYENNLPEFLRTHPVNTRRIAESRNHAAGFAPHANPSDTDFQHMQARLRVLSDKPEDALRHFRGALEPVGGEPRPADRYGYALALLATRDLEGTRRETATLLARQPEYAAYQLLRAETELAAGHNAQALDLYAATARRHPQSLAVVHRQAAALLKAGKTPAARDLLDRAVRRFPDEPALYKMLAGAAGESGRRMQAHRAFGEYYYRIGQPRAALEQLDLALRHAKNDFYYVASIEARIREIRESSGLLFKKEPPPTRKPQSPTDRK
jgi:predicted Zn-dependent protease